MAALLAMAAPEASRPTAAEALELAWLAGVPWGFGGGHHFPSGWPASLSAITPCLPYPPADSEHLGVVGSQNVSRQVPPETLTPGDPTWLLIGASGGQIRSTTP